MLGLTYLGERIFCSYSRECNGRDDNGIYKESSRKE